MYAITADPSRRLVIGRIAGFLSIVEVAAYLNELRETLEKPAFGPGYLLLIDTSQAAIQSQDVVAAFREGMQRFPKAERIAIVHPGQLARMQIRRVFAQPYARIVATEADGTAWLLRAVEPAREASAA